MLSILGLAVYRDFFVIIDYIVTWMSLTFFFTKLYYSNPCNELLLAMSSVHLRIWLHNLQLYIAETNDSTIYVYVYSLRLK